MDFLRQIFKRKERHPDNFFPSLILRKTFSTEECNKILEQLSGEIDLGSGNHYLPYKYTDVEWSAPGEYYNKQQKFLNNYQQILVEPLIERVNNLQERIKIFPIIQSEKEPYSIFTLRVLQPECADIYFHCDNEQTYIKKEFKDRISRQIQPYNYLSMVLMLQAPESGGEIVTYNMYWKSVKEVLAQRTELEQLPEKNEKIREYIKLEVGDVLIFEAGRVWHKVNQVHGTKARITAGGFLGKCVENYQYWKVWS